MVPEINSLDLPFDDKPDSFHGFGKVFYSKVAGSKAPLFRATFESKNANVKAPPFRAGIVRIFFTLLSFLNTSGEHKTSKEIIRHYI